MLCVVVCLCVCSFAGLCVLVRFGGSREDLEACGKYWGTFGTSWKHLTAFASTREHLEAFGSICDHLGALGSIWMNLRAFGSNLGGCGRICGQCVNEGVWLLCRGFVFCHCCCCWFLFACWCFLCFVCCVVCVCV